MLTDDLYAAGWSACAKWARRDDLIADIGSPAYSKERDAAIAAHLAKALEGVETFEFDPPSYHDEAMGCGLEDRGIKDRYEAMAYGWNQAMERAAEAIPDDLVSSSAVSALQAQAKALQARIAELNAALAQIANTDPQGLRADDLGRAARIAAAAVRSAK